MISVFDEASPEPNIEFYEKNARRRPFHRLHTKYRLVNRDLRSKIHKSLTAATFPSALRFLFPFMSPGRARRRGWKNILLILMNFSPTVLKVQFLFQIFPFTPQTNLSPVLRQIKTNICERTSREIKSQRDLLIADAKSFL